MVNSEVEKLTLDGKRRGWVEGALHTGETKAAAARMW